MMSTTRGPGLWLSARAAATIIALGGPTLLRLVEALLGTMFKKLFASGWKHMCVVYVNMIVD